MAHRLRLRALAPLVTMLALLLLLTTAARADDVNEARRQYERAEAHAAHVPLGGAHALTARYAVVAP